MSIEMIKNKKVKKKVPNVKFLLVPSYFCFVAKITKNINQMLVEKQWHWFSLCPVLLTKYYQLY